MANQVALLVMSHGNFAKEAVESAQLIVGKQENYDTIGVVVVDNIDDLKQQMFDKVAKLDTTSGLVILTDIIGGTPTNLASHLLQDEKIILASGFNMPVLLEVLMARGSGDIKAIEETIKNAYQYGLTLRTYADMKGDEEDDYSL